MKTLKEIQEQLDRAYETLEGLDEEGIGFGFWRRQKGYIDALEWVLDLEDQPCSDSPTSAPLRTEK